MVEVGGLAVGAAADEPGISVENSPDSASLLAISSSISSCLNFSSVRLVSSAFHSAASRWAICSSVSSLRSCLPFEYIDSHLPVLLSSHGPGCLVLVLLYHSRLFRVGPDCPTFCPILVVMPKYCLHTE